MFRDDLNGHGGKPRPDPFALLGDRVPPQNLRAEADLLGSVLLDDDVLHEVLAEVTAEDFYRDAHRTIFEAARDLYDAGKPVDVRLVAEELERRGQFKAVGGEEYLAELVNGVPHAVNALYYAQIVRQKSVSRQLVEAAAEILHDGFSNEFTSDELLEAAERRVFAVGDRAASAASVDFAPAVREAADRIEARARGERPVDGIATGWLDLDFQTGGFQAEQLIVVAARPSMGKTQWMLNVCERAAMWMGIPTLIVSLEMGRLELADRLICCRTRIDGHRLKTGAGLRPHELEMIARERDAIEKAPLYVDDAPARTVLQVGAIARRLKSRSGLGLVAVDYIQLLDGDNPRDSRQEQIAKISRRLKGLARSLHVPVIALSQLNRQAETREDHRPRMADLRESGAIEQDADMVLLLHRPDYYDPNDQPGLAEVIVAKNRNGATGTAKLTFLRNQARFEDYAPVMPPAGDPFPAGEGHPF